MGFNVILIVKSPYLRKLKVTVLYLSYFSCLGCSCGFIQTRIINAYKECYSETQLHVLVPMPIVLVPTYEHFL
jgi:hypothetical protein